MTRPSHEEILATSPHSRAIVVLARAPSAPGKTRLTANLRDDQARALREGLLLDTLEVARSIHIPVTVAYTPDDAREEIAALAGDVVLLTQGSGDLGQRMSEAIHEVWATGARHVILIGSDLPTLPSTHLDDAFAVLESGIDCVFGPADDGGYYLVGARRGVDLARILTGVSWGMDRVLEETLLAARAAGMTAALISAWFDVDLLDDLRRVASDTRHSEKRREFYRQFMS